MTEKRALNPHAERAKADAQAQQEAQAERRREEDALLRERRAKREKQQEEERRMARQAIEAQHKDQARARWVQAGGDPVAFEEAWPEMWQGVLKDQALQSAPTLRRGRTRL